MTLPDVKAKLLEGRRGLMVGVANDQSIAWGCARAFRALRRCELAITYLSDKAKRLSNRCAEALERQHIPAAGCHRCRGQLEAVFERITAEWGELDFVVHSHRLLAARYACRAVLSTRARDGLADDDGHILLVLHPHGSSCRTADEKRRHALHHDLLRVSQKVVDELQYHGPREGRARERRALHGGGSSDRRHSCSRHLAGPAGDARASGIPEFDELLAKAEERLLP